jgi:Zn-dependent M28 family amino/carboxypeptidase
VQEQPYEYRGRTYRNIYSVKPGTEEPGKVLVIGAHYDTVTGTPGADDNASAVAGLLELSRLLADVPLKWTVHFAAFTLEEPPLFRSRKMGSYVYAKSLKDSGTDLAGMICLEMIGYFTDDPGSQTFPLPFMRLMYPSKGNFITLVSNLQSRPLLKRIRDGFRRGTDLPVETLSTIFLVPGVDFSDHRSFWKFGYDAVMVTDTAFYRNPNYHGPGDRPGTLDYERMTEVVLGLKEAVQVMAGTAVRP